LGQEWFRNQNVNAYYTLWVFIIFMSVCIGGEHIAHLVQSNKLMYKLMEFYFLNWVQHSQDFGKVVPRGTTQGNICYLI
jgi:hypothetical protein